MDRVVMSRASKGVFEPLERWHRCSLGAGNQVS